MKRLLIVFTLLIGMLLVFSGCYETEYVVQGSNVLEMPFEEINGDYEIEKFSNYKNFKKSDLSDYSFRNNVAAKYDRYNKKYFETKNLLVIKFNKNQNLMNYFVKSVEFSEGKCIVALINRFSNGELINTTYYCFIETEEEIDGLDVELLLYHNDYMDYLSTIYLDDNNMPVVISGQEELIYTYIAKNTNGIEEFAVMDDVPREYLRYRIINKDEAFFTDNDLMIIQVPSSSIIYTSLVIDKDVLRVYCFSSSNYGLIGDAIAIRHVLLSVPIPKNINLNQIQYYKYYEYVDDIDITEEYYEEPLLKDSISVNLDRYTYSD